LNGPPQLSSAAIGHGITMEEEFVTTVCKRTGEEFAQQLVMSRVSLEHFTGRPPKTASRLIPLNSKNRSRQIGITGHDRPEYALT